MQQRQKQRNFAKVLTKLLDNSPEAAMGGYLANQTVHH